MVTHIDLVRPIVTPPLDQDLKPAALVNRAFKEEVSASGAAVPLVLAVERPKGSVSRYETLVFAEDHPRAEANLFYAERLLKFLLWQRGGWRVFLSGPSSVAAYLERHYAPGGDRAFDSHFMGEQVYQERFTILSCTPDQVPPEREREHPLGGQLDGCRIGFDLGASDIKVSAVIDGKVVWSDEFVWEPCEQTDPNYHYDMIMAAIRAAAAKLPRLDAIGGSSAGIYLDNRPKVASLYRGVPADKFDQVRNLFVRIQDEMGVPLEIANDGEVAALAGSMSLQDDRILGIALGSSQAGGYVTKTGGITDWLNELAFCPVDYNPDAPVDEWSGDRGCGASYLSQQCVFRLSPKVGIQVPSGVSNADKLQFVQELLERGHEGATKIWMTMGVYMGYAIAHYAGFYDLKHVLLLGRCTSGQGGHLILKGAQKVLEAEFPELRNHISIQLPDEKSRRVGQSVAAASLPVLR